MYAETRIIQTRLIRRYGSWIVISVYNIYFRLGCILKKNFTILRIIRTLDKEYKSLGSLGVRVNEVPLYILLAFYIDCILPAGTGTQLFPI